MFAFSLSFENSSIHGKSLPAFLQSTPSQKKTQCNINYKQHSFVLRSIDVWNQLTNKKLDSTSLTDLKKKIDISLDQMIVKNQYYYVSVVIDIFTFFLSYFGFPCVL